MNKILVIKQDVYGNFNNKQRLEVAKNIADIWNDTGIIAIPAYFDYEFIDCDKFMGVTIDKEISNERFENGIFEDKVYPEPPCIRVSRDTAEILKGNYVQLDDGRIIPGIRSVTFNKGVTNDRTNQET